MAVLTRTVGGLTLGELGFGGAPIGNLGREISDETALEAVHAAWESGIRYFDTAPHYGLGLSETRLGQALGGRPRAEYLLSTKVGRTLEVNPDPTGSDLAAGGFAVGDGLRRRFDFSADAVRRGLEQSLERLGVDRVDIVYVHDPDDHVEAAITQAIPALIALRDEGVIGAVGVGMNQWEAPLRMVQETDLDLVMLAGRWTLLDRSGEPLLQACRERAVGVVAAAPFNSGLLARPRPNSGATFDYSPVSAEVLARANAMADVCERLGVELPAAALQFGLCDDAVVSVVCGMRTAEQARECERRMQADLPDELWGELDKLMGTREERTWPPSR